MRLTEKVALVTGGGSGMGKATAQLFHDEGAQVAIVGRRKHVLEDAARDVSGELFCCVCDVTDEASVHSMIRDVVAQFGRIDVLVHSAGVNPNRTDLSQTDLETFQITMGASVTGAFLVAREVVAVMPPGGAIVLVGSVAAVLAFNNMSGDVEQEYFSDGISEDIITDLSKVSELHVIARNSSFTYKGRAVSVPDVAAELGVRHVLEGSVRKAGNRIRVTAQLIDATTGGHVWAERYDRDLTDIFAVQDELTREIVTALKVTLTEAEQVQLAHKGTANVEAYNLFLRGRDNVWLHTKTGNIAARELFEHAIEIDPGYAAAHALTAFTHFNDFANGWTEDPDQSLEIGLRIAQQAVTLDTAEPLAHFALSSAYKWTRNIDAALAEAQQCLTLAPNSAEGHISTAYIEIFAGNAAAAIETIDAYMRLDPHYPDIALQVLAEAHISLGQYEEAVVVLKKRQERNPDAASVYALLASCYGHLGHIAEGQKALAELFRINPEFSIERRRRVLPFKNPEDFERRVEGLRKAGLTD